MKCKPARYGYGTEGPDGMIQQDGKTPADKPDDADVSSGDAEVRVTMEKTRKAIEASNAEIERAKRLLRETEELIDLPVPPPSGETNDHSQ